MPKSSNSKVIAGLMYPADICNGFKETFKGNFKNSDDCLRLKDQFLQCFDVYMQSEKDQSNDIVFTTEQVERAILRLSGGKAGGQDSLTAEHLQNAGGRLPYLSTVLYNKFLVHGFVPDSFGSLIIVPILKGDVTKCDVFEGYRLVSLISLLSKVFELCLLEYLKQSIISDDLQLGFSSEKESKSAVDAQLCC